MLSFHAWYKYGNALVGPNYESRDANDLLLSPHQMMACTIASCPQEEGNGWKLQKLHEQLHLPITLRSFITQRTLMPAVERDFSRTFSSAHQKTSQQHGQDTFIKQVASCLHERMTIRRPVMPVRDSQSSFSKIRDDDSHLLSPSTG
jgi:hypothetical protein